MRTNYLTHSKFELLGPVQAQTKRLLAFYGAKKEENDQAARLRHAFPQGLKDPPRRKWHRLRRRIRCPSGPPTVRICTWRPPGTAINAFGSSASIRTAENRVGDAVALSHSIVRLNASRPGL